MVTEYSTPSNNACKECDECGKSCGTCGCGTDCLGAISASFSPITTNYGAFTYAFYNQFQAQGSTSYTPDFGMGHNVLVQNWAYATQFGSDFVFTWGPSRALWFDATTLAARYGARQILTHPTGFFRIMDPDSGYIYEFNDTHGLLTKIILPGKSEVINTVTNVGTSPVPRITKSELTINYGTDKRTKEIWQYDYDDNARVTSVTLIRSTGTTIAQIQTPLRKLVMSYYGASEGGGNQGNLKTVELQVRDGIDWVTTEISYYRYYTEDFSGGSTQPGYVNGVKFIVSPEAFARLKAAAGNPFVAPDSIVAQYADAYYQYTNGTGPSNSRLVTASATGAGSHRHAFLYFASNHSDAYNHWKRQVYAYDLNDGSIKITFANFVRQTLLTDFWATPGVQDDGRWIEYTIYDDDYARPVEQYTPASIDMTTSGPVYNEAIPDLDVKRYAGQGLVRLTTYSDADPIKGLVTEVKVRRGLSTSPIMTQSFTYNRLPAMGADYLVFMASSSNYPAAGGSAVTTGYGRTLHPSTLQTATLTTSPPKVPISQNGQGDGGGDPQYTTVDAFDLLGRRSSHTDALGYITESSYDMPTGGMLQSIVAKNVLNLTTDYRVDELGRTVQAMGPAFNANGHLVRTTSWTVYRDIEHEVLTAQGVAGSTDDGSEYTFTLVNPVSISRRDLAGREVERIGAIAADTAGPLSGTASFPQESWVRWSVNEYANDGDLTASRVYHSIPTEEGDSGLEGINYDRTEFGYDAMGRQNMVRSPGGTITRTVFDIRGLPIAVYVGTEDQGATDMDPDAMGGPDNDMIQVSASEYDGGNPIGGNGLLTKQTAFADSFASNNRVTTIGYDWRDRTETTNVKLSGSANVVTLRVYDNLNQRTWVYEYNGAVDDANRVGATLTEYDILNRVFRINVYGVTVGGVDSGDLTSGALKTENWYDGNGRLIKQISPGSRGYVKSAFDAAGRTTAQYAGYTTATDFGYLWSTLVGASDRVFGQSVIAYDGASHAIQSTRSMRNQGSSNTGVLPTTEARVLYSAAWYDGVGRPTASANYGTNGGSAPSRPSSAPASSSTILVSQIAYNVAGESFQTTDAAGVVTRTQFDRAGRVTRTVQNYKEGCVSECDANVTTEITYTADGNVSTLTAQNSATGDQVTRYLYGTTRGLIYADVNTVARNDLLVAEVYPDANVAEDASDQVVYTYNRLGERVTMRDQNGTTHAYYYDNVGRITLDSVTIPSGSAIDNAVRGIEMSYDIRGMVNQVTSRDGSNAVVNQVTLTYDNWRALKTDVQQHSSSGGSALTVAYTYEDDADTASKNSHRRKTCTYPNGRVLSYGYGSSNENDLLSRVESLTFNSVLVGEYNYFGEGSIAKVNYPQADVGISCTLASTTTYPGFDQFNRVTSLPWTKSSEGDQAWLKYGYDQASNRIYRRDEKAHSFDPAKPYDEQYTYDGMHRLHTMTRGLFADENNNRLASGTFGQTWELDATGNWSRLRQFDDQSDVYKVIDQTRIQNSANETTDINTLVGGAWPQPAFDRNGNMTAMPKPAEPTSSTPYTAKYDAWNRLVEVKASVTVIATYGYDGLKRQTLRTASGATQHYFYSDAWQILEETTGTSPGTDPATRQFVWGIRYIDDLVLRDRSNLGTLNERVYSLQDANWNVVATYNKTTGQAIDERYVYDPYGTSIVTNESYVPQISSGLQWETRYTGQRWDSASQTYLMRNRYYNPSLGAFLSRDPLQYLGGASLYQYVASSPLIHVDPLGYELVATDLIRVVSATFSQEYGYYVQLVPKIKGIEQNVQFGAIKLGFRGALTMKCNCNRDTATGEKVWMPLGTPTIGINFTTGQDVFNITSTTKVTAPFRYEQNRVTYKDAKGKYDEKVAETKQYDVGCIDIELFITAVNKASFEHTVTWGDVVSKIPGLNKGDDIARVIKEIQRAVGQDNPVFKISIERFTAKATFDIRFCCDGWIGVNMSSPGGSVTFNDALSKLYSATPWWTPPAKEFPTFPEGEQSFK